MQKDYDECIISKDNLEKVFNYLTTKPYKEVEGLIAAIRMSKPIEKKEEKPEEDGQPEENKKTEPVKKEVPK